jgi:coenzyme PQQ precursor peptide PqqA
MRLQGATKTEAADCNHGQRKTIMAWTTPTLVEICIGLEINGYLPAEF